MTDHLAIWWLSAEDIALIRCGGPVPLELPGYIRSALVDMTGRAGRGRLWGFASEGHIEEDHPGWGTAIGRSCVVRGGIVFRREDIGALGMMPGLVTDFKLRRWPAEGT